MEVIMLKAAAVFIVLPVLAFAELPVQSLQINLQRHVKTLSGIFPFRNYMNTASLDAAALYIKMEFQKIGTNAYFQNFTVNGHEYKNVILTIGPEANERIVIGAHYDVSGDQPGADDNASGVAGLIELARLIGSVTNTLKYR
jgi:Zn-dependent M28 family amino/carboxypeptidase